MVDKLSIRSTFKLQVSLLGRGGNKLLYVLNEENIHPLSSCPFWHILSFKVYVEWEDG